MLMLSLCKYNPERSVKWYGARIRTTARNYIALVPMTLQMKQLQRNVCSEFHTTKSLKSICFDIISTSEVMLSNNMVMLKLNPKYESIYKFITYGNREVRGNPLLKDSLTMFKER